MHETRSGRLRTADRGSASWAAPSTRSITVTVAASEVADQFGLDQVSSSRPASLSRNPSGYRLAEDRYLMTVIATASNPRSPSAASTSTAVARPTPSTPSPTCTRPADAQLFFITGADALAQILSWREAEQVFRHAHFIGVTRPGYELGDDHLPEGAVTLIEVPAMAISSTDCRRRVEEAGRSGISSPTVWCSTSPSDTCTGGGPPPRPPRSRIRRACTVRRAVELRAGST